MFMRRPVAILKKQVAKMKSPIFKIEMGRLKYEMYCISICWRFIGPM